MTTKVAINGFGRIGRNVFRSIIDRKVDLDVVGINDITDTKTLATMLKYDTSFKKFAHEVTYDENNLIVDGKKIPVSKDGLKKVDGKWVIGAMPGNPDIVLECTGLLRKADELKGHLAAGAKKVILSVPGDGLDATIVMGVNADTYNPATMNIVSNASCTTNCLAPFAKVLEDSFGIVSGFMTTIHAYTADQNLVDSPHSDLRRGRAAAANIVPTKTGAAKAIGEVLPSLNGKLDGFAVRVPVPTGSMTELTAKLKKPVTKDEVNAAMKAAADGPMKGILEYNDENVLVSSDIVKDPASSIFDAALTKIVGEGDDQLVTVCSWYDNEWGYSNRMVDVALLMAKSL